MSALDDEIAVIKMAKALESVSVEWIGFGPMRLLAYIAGGCDENLVDRFDLIALRRNHVWRNLFKHREETI